MTNIYFLLITQEKRFGEFLINPTTTTLSETKSIPVSFIWEYSPSPSPSPLRQRFPTVMTVRYNYQTRKQEEEKGHSARLITKEPVTGIMLASSYLNCCDLQCDDVFKGLKYVLCTTHQIFIGDVRCLFPSRCFL